MEQHGRSQAVEQTRNHSLHFQVTRATFLLSHHPSWEVGSMSPRLDSIPLPKPPGQNTNISYPPKITIKATTFYNISRVELGNQLVPLWPVTSSRSLFIPPSQETIQISSTWLTSLLAYLQIQSTLSHQNIDTASCSVQNTLWVD